MRCRAHASAAGRSSWIHGITSAPSTCALLHGSAPVPRAARSAGLRACSAAGIAGLAAAGSWSGWLAGFRSQAASTIARARKRFMSA
ncbi:MAG: hypothetical protein E6J91_29325 [Deltaproteobacteria bacterium]|nr:MAG: hypothetical protein E6J91_29325 [Deltaproteobacteria bacterium]